MNAPAAVFVVAVSAVLHHINKLSPTKVNRHYDQDECVRPPLFTGGYSPAFVAQKEAMSPQHKLHFHKHNRKNLLNTFTAHYLSRYTQKQSYSVSIFSIVVRSSHNLCFSTAIPTFRIKM